MLSRWANSNSFSGNTFFIFLIRFFPTLANVLVMILLSHKLDTATYGLYQTFWVQVYVLSTIACLGLQGFLLTYNPQVVAGLIQMLQRRGFVLFSVWIILVSVVFAYLQYNKLELPFIVPFAFLSVYSINIIVETILSINRKFKLLVIGNVLYTLAFIVLHIVILNDGFNINKLFTYLLFISIARFAVYLPISIGVVKNQGIVPVSKSINEVRSLWFHLGLYDMSQMLFRWVDKFIIGLLLTEELAAIYFNGSQDIPFLPLLLGAAGSAALMQLATAKNKVDEDVYIVQLLQHSSRILSSIVFPVFFFCVFFRTELFSVVLSEKYLPAVPVFLISVMAIPLRAYSFTTILQNKHRGNIINLGAFLDLLLAIVLMYPLYLVMGLPGVALGFVVSSYLQALFYLYYCGKLMNIAPIALLPLKNWFVKLSAFASAFYAVHYAVRMIGDPKTTLICGAVFLTISIAVTIGLEVRAARNRNRLIL